MLSAGFVLEGQPAGTRPDRTNQRQTRRPPDNGLNLAGRRTAARRQPAVRVRHGHEQSSDRCIGGEKRRGDNDGGGPNGILDAITEQRDRAGVTDVARVLVQRAVQLRTGNKVSQQPDCQGAENRSPARGGRELGTTWSELGHGEEAAAIVPDASSRMIVLEIRLPAARTPLKVWP